MAKKQRPYTPPKPAGPDSPLPWDQPAICGEGKETQIDIHDDGKLQLFDVPPRGSALRHPELVRLARKVNGLVTREGLACLRRKRRETALPSLDLTVAFVRDAIYLSYALPRKARSELATGRWRSPGGRGRPRPSRSARYR